MEIKEELYQVTNSSKSKNLRIWSFDEKSAVAKTNKHFRKGSKLSAKKIEGIVKGGNIARPVHANRGLEAKYRKELERLIAEMADSAKYWLQAAYRKDVPEMAELAQDASAVSIAKKYLSDLGKRWVKRFDDAAPTIADAYVRRMFKHTDSSFRSALKDAGWAVEFKMTRPMQEALQASITENISLIKSIPMQYLAHLEGVVMRAYASGRDLGAMVKEIEGMYPVTKRRAALIARDQSNKANAIVNKARQLELGIISGKWMHSHAGKNPRPSHVAANGKEFKIAEGCLIDGEMILPGEKINCRCTWRPILPF